MNITICIDKEKPNLCHLKCPYRVDYKCGLFNAKLQREYLWVNQKPTEAIYERCNICKHEFKLNEE
jgi:hypothetical protein